MTPPPALRSTVGRVRPRPVGPDATLDSPQIRRSDVGPYYGRAIHQPRGGGEGRLGGRAQGRGGAGGRPCRRARFLAPAQPEPGSLPQPDQPQGQGHPVVRPGGQRRLGGHRRPVPHRHGPPGPHRDAAGGAGEAAFRGPLRGTQGTQRGPLQRPLLPRGDGAWRPDHGPATEVWRPLHLP